jgi:hypothetical protein
MQWIVLCGIPYRGSGATASPDPTNQFHYFGFPLPTWGRPHGHREAPLLLCNSQRVAHATFDCKRCPSSPESSLCNSLRIATGPAVYKVEGLWKASCFCGKAPFYCRAINPKSVSPLTKNCMARATSKRPMMRTRMRIPVSPSTLRTLPAPASTQ